MEHTLRGRLTHAATKLASLAAAAVATVALLGSQIGLAQHYRDQLQAEAAARDLQRLAAASTDLMCR
jgi:hypothetical protein